MSYESGDNQTGSLGTPADFRASHKNLNMEKFKRPKKSNFPPPDQNRFLDRELLKIKALKSD